MIQQSTLQNGLQIVTEHIENVSVVAIHCGIPAGIATNLLDGQSAILAELIQRGAQGLSAQEHNESLDLLGVRKHVNCGNEFMFMSGVMLSSVFEEALSLLCGYVLDPEMPESDLLACKQLCLQAIASLADDPSSQASIAANLYHHPAPFNRSGLGSASIIEHTSMVDLHDLLRTRFLPEGSIFSIAGNVSHEDAVIVIDRATSSWKGSTAPTEETDPPIRGHHWIEHDSSQVHIAIAADSPNADDEHAICEAIATVALGGASSGRLFTEVRQRKSLVYSVAAQYGPSKHRSIMRIHAGTTPDNAEETIDVCLLELEKMKQGITAEEFERVVRRMKSRVIMHGESTAARASAIWSDQYALAKARSLQDRLDEYDRVTLEHVNDWLSSRTFGNLTLVALGPNEIHCDVDKLSQC